MGYQLNIHSAPENGSRGTGYTKGVAPTVMTSDKVRNCVMRNNLFAGSDDRYVVCFESPMEHCDFDYEGFAVTGKCARFPKWHKVRDADLKEVRAKAPVYRHAIEPDPSKLLAWYSPRFVARLHVALGRILWWMARCVWTV